MEIFNLPFVFKCYENESHAGVGVTLVSQATFGYHNFKRVVLVFGGWGLRLDILSCNNCMHNKELSGLALYLNVLPDMYEMKHAHNNKSSWLGFIQFS